MFIESNKQICNREQTAKTMIKERVCERAEIQMTLQFPDMREPMANVTYANKCSTKANG